MCGIPVCEAAANRLEMYVVLNFMLLARLKLWMRNWMRRVSGVCVACCRRHWFQEEGVWVWGGSNPSPPPKPKTSLRFGGGEGGSYPPPSPNPKLF